MILLMLLELIFTLLQALFSWLSLPAMPEEITNVVDTVIQYVVDALPLLWCFFDKSVVTVAFVLVLALTNFDKLYYFTMWLIAKLPIGINKN